MKFNAIIYINFENCLIL